MVLLTPYVVEGAQHSARLFRRQLQLASSGAAGVGLPNDFRVLPLNVPGAGFRVSAGSALVPSRDSGVANRETYGVENDGQITVNSVTGTGSGSGRTDMVIVEVMDPSMQAVTYPVPPSPETAAYSRIRVVQGVPASAKTVADVPALNNVTAYALALIKWPASTGTITAGMITDLREVAFPRRSEIVFARPRIAADDTAQRFLTATLANGGEYFPGGAGSPNEFQVDIPEWATRMVIDASWLAVHYGNDRRPLGRYWIEFGDEYRNHTWPNKRQWEFQTQEFRFNASRNTVGSSTNWLLMDEVPVPAKLRGKPATFVFKAGVENIPGANHTWMDWSGGLGCRITFAERAIDSDML